ncbi:hypothetical protein ABER98_01625 [Domibacillus aminovorans]|uniref:hypothetical protein n=1 Tax=Domibacillus aminovorans TaxID=29332 RepID=UPI003D22EA55
MIKEHFSKLDAALILAILAACSYALVYQLHVGYLGYYGLGSPFIELNISTMTPALLIVLIVFSIIILIANIIWNILFSKMKHNSKVTKSHSKISFETKSMLTLLISFVIIQSTMEITSGLGKSMAESRSDYFVINQDNRLYVDLVYYKDLIVIAPVDIKSATVSPNYKVIEMKSLKNAEAVEFIDGLKLKKAKLAQEYSDKINPQE